MLFVSAPAERESAWGLHSSVPVGASVSTTLKWGDGDTRLQGWDEN